MIEDTNIQAVRKNYEAVSRGDISALLNLLTADVEWHMGGPNAIPYAGSRRGREEVENFFELLGQTLEFQQFEPREFISQGDTVVVLGHERSLVKPTNRVFEQDWAHVYTMRDGRIAKCRIYEDTAAQVEAFRDAA